MHPKQPQQVVNAHHEDTCVAQGIEEEHGIEPEKPPLSSQQVKPRPPPQLERNAGGMEEVMESEDTEREEQELDMVEEESAHDGLL